MVKIDNSIINDIKNKIDILAVVSKYLSLTTRGKNYFAQCPFHDDHSPSLSVSKDRQMYTCWSCGATGNVFKFIQDYEHISFLESVKKCADMAGVELDIKLNDADSIPKKNKELYEIYDVSQKFYQNNINSSMGKEAKKYLYDRSLTDEEIKKFEIGLSLDEYDMLSKLLQKKNFSDKDLIKSGLVNANDEGLYDIYRGRIMFPLHDTNGHVIGYNGRIYRGETTNKYVNSKETELFKKSDYLYNYHRAKTVAREKKEIIVMEGPMDVIRASTIGYDNVVATLGTSNFGPTQANLVKRLSDNVIICFDGDDAGLKGTKSAIVELQKIGINPKIVRLPENLDPDDYIKKYGKEKFDEAISKAYDVLEFKEILLKKEINLDSVEDVSKYIKSMINEINKIDDDILRDLTINRLAEETRVSKDIILSKINVKDKIEEPIVRKQTKLDKYKKSIEGLLYYMLEDTDAIELYDKKITYIPEDNYRHLGFQICAFYKKNGYIDVADLLTEIRDDEETVKTIGQITRLSLSDKNKKSAIDDYLKNIKEYTEKNKVDKYKSELAMSNNLDEKLALANKLIEYKLRSEENV